MSIHRRDGGTGSKMGAWGCPHEVGGRCGRVRGVACDPGMKGCLLFGRFVWSVEAKNRPPKRPRPARPTEVSDAAGEDADEGDAA
ncbi:MAG: hypothetical protein U1E66_13450 [Rhodospirillales bacterium]